MAMGGISVTSVHRFKLRFAARLPRASKNLKDPRYQLLKAKILSVVHTDARSVLGFTTANMERCFAIRAGINDMLDIARQVYCKLIDHMQTLVDKLKEEHILPPSLNCNATLGYHIEMEAPRRRSFEIDDLPVEFIEAHGQAAWRTSHSHTTCPAPCAPPSLSPPSLALDRP